MQPEELAKRIAAGQAPAVIDVRTGFEFRAGPRTGLGFSTLPGMVTASLSLAGAWNSGVTGWSGGVGLSGDFTGWTAVGAVVGGAVVGLSAAVAGAAVGAGGAAGAHATAAKINENNVKMRINLRILLLLLRE